MLRLQITSKHDIYDLVLQSKVTCIVGMSGTQKTQMVKRIFENNPAIKKIISDISFAPVYLTESTWLNAMETLDKKCIYFVDDEDFIFQPEFIRLYNANTTSYFVFINRIGAGISYDASDIYILGNDDGLHRLQQKYTWNTDINVRCQTYSEDKGSGLTWFKQLIPGCLSVDGVPNVSRFLLGLEKGTELNLAIDIFGMGFYAAEIFCVIRERKLNIHFFSSYGCFEFLILSSNMFNYSLTDKDILKYRSKEIACEEILFTLTGGKYYKYDKSSNLNFCYYKDCCMRSRRDKCDKGMSGDKFEALLRGTPFEYILKFKNKQ